SATPPPPGCPSSPVSVPTARQRASLYGDIGAVDTLWAQQQPISQAEHHYNNALRNYATALDEISARDDSFNSATAAPGEDTGLSCYALAVKLFNTGGAAGDRGKLDLLAPAVDRLNADQAPLVLQLADTCYSHGFANKARSLAALSDQEKE